MNHGYAVACIWAVAVAGMALQIIVPAVLRAIEVMHLAVNPLG